MCKNGPTFQKNVQETCIPNYGWGWGVNLEKSGSEGPLPSRPLRYTHVTCTGNLSVAKFIYSETEQYQTCEQLKVLWNFGNCGMVLQILWMNLSGLLQEYNKLVTHVIDHIMPLYSKCINA